jgi:hypothetical protein
VLTPEFLAPSVLLQSQDPTGVFIVHKDLLEAKGRYFLSRFSEADGKVVWNSALAVSEIHSVLPGEGKLLILGSLNEGEGKGHERLVAVDWVSGAVSSFDQLENANYPVKEQQ